MAEERGAVLGHEVGYCIRFDDCTNPLATRIKVSCRAAFPIVNKEDSLRGDKNIQPSLLTEALILWQKVYESILALREVSLLGGAEHFPSPCVLAQKGPWK